MPDDADYDALTDLGFSLFGPVVGLYLLWLDDEFQRVRPETVFFIGREGHHLLRLSQFVAERRKSTFTPKRRYLTVSRAFLFKLMLADPQNYGVTLTHPFRGSAADFFQFRYGLTYDQVTSLGLLDSAAEDLVPSVDVPRDRDLVQRMLQDASSALEEFVRTRIECFQKYLAWLEFSSHKNYFADIGFSGTIQSCLSILTKTESHGWYFYKSSSFGSAAPSELAVTGDAYWATNARFGDGDALVDWSLVLESIFTSPVGQLVDVLPKTPGNGRDNWQFVYGPETRVQRQFHKTHGIVDGIERFLDTIIKDGLSHEEVRGLVDARRVYELTLRYDRSSAMRSLIDLIEIDDGISGNGLVRPFGLLRIGA